MTHVIRIDLANYQVKTISPAPIPWQINGSQLTVILATISEVKHVELMGATVKAVQLDGHPWPFTVSEPITTVCCENTSPQEITFLLG